MKKLHNDLFVSGQISADDFAQLQSAGIKTIINNRPDNEEPGQLSADAAQALAAEYGIDYHFLPMVNGQPLSPETVARFKDVLDSTSEPVLAHCRSGMRSAFIWALGQISAGNITADQAISAASDAGIPLANARPALEQAAK